MAQLPEYQRQVSPGGAPSFDSSTGGPERHAVTQTIFARLAGRVSAMADRVTEAASERLGLRNGMDKEFRPTHGNSIAARAYDKAGTRAFLDTQGNVLGAEIDRLAIQHEADPQGLAAAIAALEAKTVGDLREGNFPEAEVAFAGMFSRARTSYVREAIRQKQAKDEAVFLAAANAATQRNLNEIDRISYSGGLDPEAGAVAAGAVEEVRRRTETGVEAGVYTPEQARQLVAEAETRAKAGRFYGAFDRLKTVEEKQALYERFNSEYAENADGLADILTGEDAERIRRYMETGINNAQADSRAALRDIDQAASSIEDRNADGFSAPPTEIAALEAAAADTGDPVAVQRVTAMKNFQALTEQMVTMSPLEIETLRRQTVIDMEKNGATPRATEVLKAIDSVKTGMEKALTTDPYAWGVRAGKIEPTPALTFDGSPAGAATLATRVRARNRLREHYGTVPFFTAAEKDALKSVARNGGAPALAIAQQLVSALGADATEAIAEFSADAPVLANMAGRIASGGGGAVGVDAMAALEERRIPDYKPVTIRDAAEQLTARDTLGGAYLADPRAEQAVRAEARLAWEKRARDTGFAGDVSDDTEALALYEQALDEAAGATLRGGVKYGGLDEVNGGKVIVPPDAAEGEVEDLLHRVADLAALPPIGSANGVAIDAGDIQGATLVNVGPGRWRVALGDPRTADPRYVMTPAGDFWTIGIDDLRRAAGASGAAGAARHEWMPLGDPLRPKF